MKIRKIDDNTFNVMPDVFDYAALATETEFIIANYDGTVPDGFHEFLDITVRGNMRTQLNEFGIKDTEAAMRQLSFYGRKMAKERQSALEALARMLFEEQARLEDGDRS